MVSVRHSQRASNHNRVGTFGEMPFSVRHSQRASNHNVSPFWSCQFRVYVILKEHQITTDARVRSEPAGVYVILKEHQITTDRAGDGDAGEVYVILKGHQITTPRSGGIRPGTVYVILKEHQITTPELEPCPFCECTSFSKSIKSQRTAAGGDGDAECTSFSKSIKSQLDGIHRFRAASVRHSQRASNHN